MTEPVMDTLDDENVPVVPWPMLPFVDDDTSNFALPVVPPLDTEDMPVVPLPAKLAPQDFDGHKHSSSEPSETSTTSGPCESSAADASEETGGATSTRDGRR